MKRRSLFKWKFRLLLCHYLHINSEFNNAIQLNTNAETEGHQND